MSTISYDFIIVGAGIVGLTVAYEIKSRAPSASVAVIDKEQTFGLHASGRNSGVLHCGIYYGSDTLKARVCAKGAARMIEFADEHGISYSKSGKVILATSEHQLPTVNQLLQNAKENGIRARKIGGKELREIEPNAAQGFDAIYCPDTAVIDSPAVLKCLHSLLEKQGVKFLWGQQARGENKSGELKTLLGNVSFGFMINCAGAHADTLARQFGLATQYSLIPFKGIYWKLSQSANHLVRANIYPVPDVSVPFLGVHLTKAISGDVYIGPTAIPALGRENYGKLKGAKLGEAISIGAQMVSMYLGNQNNFRLLTHAEIAKYRKGNFLMAAQQLVPSLSSNHMVSTPKVGIRPQLVNLKTQKLEMDYIIERTENSVHVLNAISPAFTSSFAFAEMIVDCVTI